MAVMRIDNVAAVVDDLEAAKAFFLELGMEVEGQGMIEGLFADQTVGLDGVRSEIVMMRVPGGGPGKIELTKFHHPAVVSDVPENAPPNKLGGLRVMFAVDDIEDAVARLRKHGGELLGEIADYEGIYKLCYLRGPSGMLLALAEDVR